MGGTYPRFVCRAGVDVVSVLCALLSCLQKPSTSCINMAKCKVTSAHPAAVVAVAAMQSCAPHCSWAGKGCFAMVAQLAWGPQGRQYNREPTPSPAPPRAPLSSALVVPRVEEGTMYPAFQCGKSHHPRDKQGQQKHGHKAEIVGKEQKQLERCKQDQR